MITPVSGIKTPTFKGVEKAKEEKIGEENKLDKFSNNLSNFADKSEHMSEDISVAGKNIAGAVTCATGAASGVALAVNEADKATGNIFSKGGKAIINYLTEDTGKLTQSAQDAIKELKIKQILDETGKVVEGVDTSSDEIQNLLAQSGKTVKKLNTKGKIAIIAVAVAILAAITAKVVSKIKAQKAEAAKKADEEAHQKELREIEQAKEIEEAKKATKTEEAKEETEEE